jgi:hypothetical protein
MMDDDPLRPLLHEWQAPEPSAGMDARIRAAYLAKTAKARRSGGTGYVVLAAALLSAAALAIAIRPMPPAARPEPELIEPAYSQPGYVTRLGTSGFRPLPDGAARVVPAGEVKPVKGKQ